MPWDTIKHCLSVQILDSHTNTLAETHMPVLSPIAAEVFRPASGHRYVANDQVETLLDPVALLTLLA